MFESNVIAICFFVVSTRLITWPTGCGTAAKPVGETKAVGSNATVTGVGVGGGGVVGAGGVGVGVGVGEGGGGGVVGAGGGGGVVGGRVVDGGAGADEAAVTADAVVGMVSTRAAVLAEHASNVALVNMAMPARMWRRLAAGVPKASASILSIELIDHDDATLLHPLDDELRNPITPAHLIGLDRIGVDKRHTQLSPVSRVDEAGRVQHGHAVLRGQAAAGLHKTGVSQRNRQREACRNHGTPTTRGKQYVLTGNKIEAGVADSGIAWIRQVWV